MRKLQKILIFTLLIFGNSLYAQDRSMHEVYSLMLINFVKYIQWPDHSQTGDFVIGVVGNDHIFNTLSTLYGGKIRGNKTYVIKKFSNASEITPCQVIFIDKSKSTEFTSISSRVKGTDTLIITDKEGLGEKGSAINFRIVNSKVKFELNQKVIEASNLKVSSTLSSMAIMI